MSGQRTTSNQCDAWETGDYGGLNVEKLGIRAEYYARKAGASDKATGGASDVDAICNLVRS